MRFIVLFLPLFVLLAMEFSYEQDAIYLLNNDEFSLKDGDLRIDFNALDKSDKHKETLKTTNATTILQNDLNFYQHLKKRPNDNDLVRLRKRQNIYFTRIKKQDGNFVILSQNGTLKALQNCYILLKNTKRKIIATKSSANVLDLDDKIDFQNINNNSLTDAYFGCFGDGHYIF